MYSEASAYIGELTGDTLIKLVDAPKLRTDYNAEEITQKREIYRAAQNIADDAKSALAPFDEYDN